MKKVLALLLLLSTTSFANQIRVLEIDTGVDLSSLEIRNHVNMANWEKEDYIDIHGHGTHIAGIILKDTCKEVELISCKYYSPYNRPDQNFKKNLECFNKALDLKPDLINYSSGGQTFIQQEHDIIAKFRDLFITLITAAGNDGLDLSKSTNNYYPAKYGLKNVIIVGNLENDKTKNKSSNYGLPGMVWEIGTNVQSNWPHNMFTRMTGTSQATASYTNKILKELCYEENH